MTFRYPSNHFGVAGQWSATAFVFFIPLSTALMNLFMALTILFLGLSGEYKRQVKHVFTHPFVLAALALLTFMGIATLWSSVDLESAMSRLGKYAKLLLPMLMLPLFLNGRRLGASLTPLLAAISLILLGVYAIVLGVFDEIPAHRSGQLFHFTLDGGFKSRIITSVLMAFSAYAFAQLALKRQKYRALFGVLSILAAGYVLFLSGGLTGRLILFALLGLLGVQIVGVKRGLAVLLLAAVVALPTMYTLSDSFRERIENVRKLSDPGVEQPKSSIAHRIDLLRSGTQFILEKPLFGHGTGAVIHTRPNSPEPEIMNIHNQYLMLWAEGGVLPLMLLIVLFYTHWRLSRSLPEFEQHLSQGLLATMAIGCLTNSWITDSGESHFYLFFATAFLANTAGALAKRPDHNG